MNTATNRRPIRIGTGFDIHALGPGDHVILGGVRIAHDQALIAHSDGDVLIHALCDALLGALALGDIGVHFPPSDARWKGVDSRELLRHCVRLVHEHGYFIGNVDATVIAERPKLSPHTPTMRSYLAEDLGVDMTEISIKATTNEKLGALGREQGIAAQAAVILFSALQNAPFSSAQGA